MQLKFLIIIIVYFGTSQGIYFLPNDATKVKKINGIDDNVIALTVDKENNIYYATEDYQAYIYYNNGSIVKIEGLNDELDDNHITALALDSNDTLYLGTFAGIYYLLSGATRVEKFNVNDEEGTNN
ncbi:two-component regulator propeller domain-containing protein [Spiroplasma citri]|uniref:two-component regulator propeller domain-containing protein n=1 Tax=Spiroplasma citri TaxID=2133 RepID=UPI001EE1F093|nr:two-component regulator propeller domain-containing protein [Spiroplasma citri]